MCNIGSRACKIVEVLMNFKLSRVIACSSLCNKTPDYRLIIVHFIKFLKFECQFCFTNHLGSNACILLHNGVFQSFRVLLHKAKKELSDVI